jgi:hypothetical protein
MAVSFAELEDIAVEALNASQPSSTYGDVNSGRFKAGEITPPMRLIDLSIARQILNNPNDGRRAAYLTTSNIAHGAAIPTHISPLDAIYMTITGGQYAGTRAVELWPLSKLNELEDENRNPQANPFISPHAIIENNTVFHNAAAIVAGGASGVTVTLRYPTLTHASGGSNIQSPDEFAWAIVNGALSLLVAKDGQRISAANHFEQVYLQEMKMLQVSAPELGQIAQMQEAA